MHWHWQNLNNKKDGTTGYGLRHGRCWWYFNTAGPGKSVRLEWNLWTRSCMLEFDINDEDLTFHFGLPPVAFWLSFSVNWWLVRKLAPTCKLSKRYGTEPKPDDITVIDERECGIGVHSGRVWIKPWVRGGEWRKSDPWWVRGVSFSINPFEWKHQKHEVRCADYSKGVPPYHYWEPYVGSYETGPAHGLGGKFGGKQPDHREKFTFPYKYVLRNGKTQERTATVYVERMTWRPRCLQWTSWFEKERISINIDFSDEVGERTGSWKGGTIGCGWNMLPSELYDPEAALRRMERERVFN